MRRAATMATVIAIVLSVPIPLGILTALSRPAVAAAPSVLIDDATHAYYNSSLGSVLNGSAPEFPPTCNGPGCPHLTVSPVSAEPDLSLAHSILGSWLSGIPPMPSSSWAGPAAIPRSWEVGTETAIVYALDAGTGGVRDATLKIGVDNGAFVWVNGLYRFGAVHPGGAIAGEYVVDLGDLPAGATLIQVLRADHGGLTDYTIEVTGSVVPGPIDTDGDGYDDVAEAHEDSDAADSLSVPPLLASNRTAERVREMAGSPDTASAAVPHLHSALRELVGNNVGAASNGAIDKLTSGDTVAALEKLGKVSARLATAGDRDPQLDVAPPRVDVVLVGRTVASAAVARVEIDRPASPAVAAARQLISEGDSLRAVGKFPEAHDRYKKAAAKALGATA